MESTPETSSALSWIPQIFYDLIGRVVPGVAVLAASLLLFESSIEARNFIFYLFADSEIPLSVVVLVGLVASYLVSVLLGAVGFLIKGREWMPTPLKLSVHESPNLGDPEILRSFMYDAVQLYNTQAGARLAKLAAEQHMCRVLMAGFTMLGVIKVGMHFLFARSETLWPTVLLSLGVAVCSWLFHRHLDIRSTRLLSNHWYALELAKKTRAEPEKSA